MSNNKNVDLEEKHVNKPVASNRIRSKCDWEPDSPKQVVRNAIVAARPQTVIQFLVEDDNGP